jgi:hypothetical protein
MDMMELDGLAQDVDALFGIDGLQEDLMDVAYLGASAGVAVVAGEWLFDNVEILKKQTGYARAGIAIVLGAAGGIAAGRFVNKAVGAGIAAGLIGWGVSKAIQKAANLVPASAGLGQMSDRDLLLGMGQAVDNDIYVSDYRPLPGQTDGLAAVDNEINVSDYRPLPGQTDGLGQAGDVYASDLSPMPGQHGSSGYMAGLAASFA